MSAPKNDRTGVAATALAEAVAAADAALDRLMPAADAWPARLHEAMRYSVFAGGKRLRPALVREACVAAGGTFGERVDRAMAAVELIHTYTLVHDDLPAMDDDDLRRGRPTCHKAYDEATAILAGDALQSLAFEVVAPLGGDAVAALAAAIGSRGVVGGQQEDIEAEGATDLASPAARARLERIHRGKTAALIRASCALGAIAADAPSAMRTALATYGEALGLAFQIADDVLDATASAATLGKTPGKDAAQGKLTYVAAYGLDAARIEAARQRDEAVAALAGLPRGERLRAIADFVVGRDR